MAADLPDNPGGADLLTSQDDAAQKETPATLDLTPTDDTAVGDDAHASDLDAASRDPVPGEPTFPIVGIGASAGGLQAFQDFFAALPANPYMAFVLVQHLSPVHESALAEIIQAQTQMVVTQVTDHPVVEPNRVYVIPPGKLLEMADGHLQLVDRSTERGRPTAVDHFLRSLVKAVGDRAVGVVLSGTGSDGSLGIRTLKEGGGLTMAQSPESSEDDGMPTSAIATGLVDLVGTPAELAARLVAVRDFADLVQIPAPSEDVPETDADALRAIFSHLRQRTGHDFTHYKRSTILRRLARRMQVAGVASLPGYVSHLRRTPDEASALLRDFLISVTQFFRDPEAFEVLEAEAFPSLFDGSRSQIRVWVPGCATGEEAYSLAILLCEHAAALDPRPDIQVFATDIDEQGLAIAREGMYPDVIAADVSPDRLARFFESTAGGYRVKTSLRESVLFATHNLVADPPFSRLDLVSCRNVLIYFNHEFQERALHAFHYGLRPDGFLFLGSAETPTPVAEAFVELDRRARVYRRRKGGRASAAAFAFSRRTARASDGTRPDGAAAEASAVTGDAGDLLDRYRDWTLDRYAPARVLVDDRYDLLHVFGRAGDYLRDREGPVTHHVIDKVTTAFRIDLRTALYRAFSHGESVDTPFRRVEVGTDTRVVRLHVGMVGGAAAEDGLAEVVFIELDPASVSALAPRVEDGDATSPALSGLEDELVSMRQRLQSTVEEHEASNEEHEASTEELQSMNEELQSTSEELETSKEELQSINEELTTVNQELRTKVDEVSRSNSDLLNLMAATDVGILFLDRELRLQRYTPRAGELFNVIPADIGRPFDHLTHRIDRTDVPDLARQVIDSLQPSIGNVGTTDDRTYSLRMVPYRTVDDHIDGVVLSFVDVTDIEAAKAEASLRADLQEAVAQIGEIVLEGGPLADVFGMAVARVRDVLGADACKVLRYEPDAHQLRLVAGVGWSAGAVGEATVTDEAFSQAGYTLLSRVPVLVDDLDTESRFEPPPLLTSHGMKSGMSVVIPSQEADAPYGVLGVHCRHCRSYSDSDGRFLQSVANVLAEGIVRHDKEDQIRAHLAEIEAYFEAVPVGIAIVDGDGRFVRVNTRLAELARRAVEAFVGQSAAEFNPRYVETHGPYVARVFATGLPILNVEMRLPRTPDEAEAYDWLVGYYPILDDGAVRSVSIVVQDVTPLKKAQVALERLTDQLEARVAERTAQVRQLATALTDAEQRERGRLSEILHDDLQQLLYAIQIKSQLLDQLATAAEPESLRRVVGQIQEIVSQAIQTTRTLTVDLSPPILQGEGIGRSLEWLAPRMRDAYNLEVTVARETDAVLNPAVHALVFQSVRELLFNIVKHAGVERAEVRVWADGADCIHVAVSDEGSGFDPAILDAPSDQRVGLGLLGVRERLDLVGGGLEIDSGPDRGTTLTVIVPKAAVSEA